MDTDALGIIMATIEIIKNVIKDDLPLNIRRMKANIFLSTLDKFYYNVEAL